MANYVKVAIVCPCGKLLQMRNNNADSGSTTRGQSYCSACKRNVQWAVTGASAYTNYK